MGSIVELGTADKSRYSLFATGLFFEYTAMLSSAGINILRMVRVGEQTGNMSEQFNLLADHYLDKVDKLVAAMSKTIEPLIIAVAGFIFAIIALSLLGPVYNMISQIA